MQREEIIANIIKDKDVLDVGSLGQSNEYCLWNVICDHCKSITGVDLPDAAHVAENMFFINKESLSHKEDQRIIYGNIENISIDKKFDVVTAGDIIEHVSNQGLFLDNIYKHLHSNGKLIITTPNAKWPTVFLKPNSTHTFWHDRYTLSTILLRHNFKITYFRYYYGNKKHYSWWKIPLVVRQSILIIAEKI